MASRGFGCQVSSSCHNMPETLRRCLRIRLSLRWWNPGIRMIPWLWLVMMMITKHVQKGFNIKHSNLWHQRRLNLNVLRFVLFKWLNEHGSFLSLNHLTLILWNSIPQLTSICRCQRIHVLTYHARYCTFWISRCHSRRLSIGSSCRSSSLATERW